LSSKGRFPFLPESFVVGSLIVFMPAESHQTWRRASQQR
jgi:hypothetical protein